MCTHGGGRINTLSVKLRSFRERENDLVGSRGRDERAKTDAEFKGGGGGGKRNFRTGGRFGTIRL